MFLYRQMPYPPKGQRALRNTPEWENDEEYITTYMKIMNQELLKFKWNLPDTCDGRFLELSFITYGKGMIVIDKGVPYTLHTNPYSEMNKYGYFRKATGWAWDGYTFDGNVYVPGTDPELFKGNAVIGYDNPMRYPMHHFIHQQTLRELRALRGIDVTVNNLKTPYIIKCAEEQVQTVKEAIRKKDANHGYIVLSEASNIIGEGIEVWPQSTSPQVLTEMWNHYFNIENYGRESRGITSNPSSDKRERELTSEIASNNLITQINVEYRKYERDLFCELVNTCLGLDISYEYVYDEIAEEVEPDTIQLDSDNDPTKGGDDND